MTVISEPIADIAGLGEHQKVTFWTTVIRENDSGSGTVTTRKHEFTPVGGVLTTTDLDVGPAKVRIGQNVYDIEIPESASPIRLWPLIDAGMPPPTTDTELFVRNGGGIRRAQALTQAEYNAIPTPDPETFYVITP